MKNLPKLHAWNTDTLYTYFIFLIMKLLSVIQTLVLTIKKVYNMDRFVVMTNFCLHEFHTLQTFYTSWSFTVPELLLVQFEFKGNTFIKIDISFKAFITKYFSIENDLIENQNVWVTTKIKCFKYFGLKPCFNGHAMSFT